MCAKEPRFLLKQQQQQQQKCITSGNRTRERMMEDIFVKPADLLVTKTGTCFKNVQGPVVQN